MTEIRFFVPGIPRTAGSKRAFIPKGWTRAIITDDSGKAGKDWRFDVKRFASEAYKGPPMEGPLEVEFVFQISRPNGHFGTGKNRCVVRESAPEYPTTRPDLLKYARSLEDACTGILWADDSQIVVERLQKVYGIPGAWLNVRQL